MKDLNQLSIDLVKEAQPLVAQARLDYTETGFGDFDLIDWVDTYADCYAETPIEADTFLGKLKGNTLLHLINSLANSYNPILVMDWVQDEIDMDWVQDEIKLVNEIVGYILRCNSDKLQ